jgi:hypothetical protein
VLLYAGGIHKQQSNERYKNIFEILSDIAVSFVTIHEVVYDVKLVMKHELHQKGKTEIKQRKMTYLNTHHEQEIVNRIFEKGQNFQELSTYFEELKRSNQHDQSYMSPTAWYHYMTNEWKR